MRAPLVIRPVHGSAEEALFIRVPALVGGHAAGWSVTPFGDAKHFFDPGFNGALAEWHLQKFIAWRGDKPVGRIGAAWPRQATTDLPGSFGFLACERDSEVLVGLLDAAKGALRYWGAVRMRGPMSYSVNHEIGAMTLGFDEPGMVKMPRTPTWLPDMFDDYGLLSEKDVNAHTLVVTEERHSAAFAPRLAAWAGKGDLTIRRISPRRWQAEVSLIVSLYNDAWAENWAAQPVSAAEADMLARLMRPVALSGAMFIAEWKGTPIGLLTVIPNIEEATEGLDGRLGLRGTWRLFRAAVLGRTRSARVPMLGTIRAVRGTEESSMAVGALLSTGIDFARKRGWERLEISWVLEDNGRMRRVMERLPASVNKSWRVWGMEL